MVDEIDQVIELDLGFKPEPAVSGAVLTETEYSTFLTFNAVRRLSDGSVSRIGWAFIEFTRCIITKFGYPNDEALDGHPLRGKGLYGYGIFEVLISSWI